VERHFVPRNLVTVANGRTALVKLRADRTHIEKVLYPGPSDCYLSVRRDLRHEYAAYHRPPQHSRLL